jgi:hypothetical protein
MEAKEMIDFRFENIGDARSLTLLYNGKEIASEIISRDNERLMHMTLLEVAEYILTLRLENALSEGDGEREVELASALYSLRRNEKEGMA